MPLLSRCAIALLVAALPLRAQDTQKPQTTLPGRVVFSVGESFADRAGRTRLLLQVVTEKKYPCASPVTARRTKQGDTITVDQWRYSPSRIFCEGEDGPAYGEIPLGVDAGRYTIAIRHLGAEDRYRVTITGDAIRVAPLRTPTVSILRDTLAWRFPRNSFAVACGTTEKNAWMCAEVFRMLATSPGITPVEIPAVGLNPFGNATGDRGNWHNERLRYFRTDPSNMSRVRRDVQRFYDAYVGPRNGYSITIIPWTNDRWFTQSPRDGENR